MWFLIPKDAPDDRLHLPVGKQLLVGRCEGHVTIDDLSVSRKHAVITVTKATAQDGATKFRVTLRDMSKFGSFVNGEKLLKGEHEVADGDNVCFGVPTGIQFRLRQEPLVVCCSTINSATRAQVLRKLQHLGGELASDWSRRCTHLLMTKVSITIKVIGALIQGCPVVTPDFLFHLDDFFEGKRATCPQPRDYQPVVSQESQHLENTDVDLRPRPERKSLFTGDTFIFLTEKRFQRLTTPLQLGGARCLLWESAEDCRRQGGESVIAADGSLVFYEDEATPWHRQVYDILRKHRRRPITDAEIGYAVLACSKEDYCNVRKKCDQLAGRHDASSLSLTQNPFDITTQASGLSQGRMMGTMEMSQDVSVSVMQSECLLANTSDVRETFESTMEIDMKAEVESMPDVKPEILVPQTPPAPAADEDPDVTSVTRVPCSLEPKIEDDWSADAFETTTTRGHATIAEHDGEEEDPFDSIALRRKRRRRENENLTPTPTRSPVKPRRPSSPSVEEEESLREPPHEVAREPAREATRESAREPVCDPARAREAAREQPRETAREPARETAREQPREAAREPARETTREQPRETAREPARETAREPARESAREPARAAARELTLEADQEEDLPRNCGSVKVVSLLRKVAPSRPRQHRDGPNFKKFRKVHRRTIIHSAPVMVASSRVGALQAVEPEEQPVSQGDRNALDSEADRLFEEMRRVAPKRRR